MEEIMDPRITINGIGRLIKHGLLKVRGFNPQEVVEIEEAFKATQENNNKPWAKSVKQEPAQHNLENNTDAIAIHHPTEEWLHGFTDFLRMTAVRGQEYREATMNTLQTLADKVGSEYLKGAKACYEQDQAKIDSVFATKDQE